MRHPVWNKTFALNCILFVIGALTIVGGLEEFRPYAVWLLLASNILNYALRVFFTDQATTLNLEVKRMLNPRAEEVRARLRSNPQIESERADLRRRAADREQEREWDQ